MASGAFGLGTASSEEIRQAIVDQLKSRRQQQMQGLFQTQATGDFLGSIGQASSQIGKALGTALSGGFGDKTEEFEQKADADPRVVRQRGFEQATQGIDLNKMEGLLELEKRADNLNSPELKLFAADRRAAFTQDDTKDKFKTIEHSDDTGVFKEFFAKDTKAASAALEGDELDPVAKRMAGLGYISVGKRNINTMTPEGQATLLKLSEDRFKELRTQADVNTNVANTAETITATLEGLPTTPAEELMNSVRGLGVVLGLSDDEMTAKYSMIKDAKAMQNRLAADMLQKFGGSDTEKELEISLKSVPSITQTPLGREILTEFMKLERDVAVFKRDFADQIFSKENNLLTNKFETRLSQAIKEQFGDRAALVKEKIDVARKKVNGGLPDATTEVNGQPATPSNTVDLFNVRKK